MPRRTLSVEHTFRPPHTSEAAPSRPIRADIIRFPVAPRAHLARSAKVVRAPSPVLFPVHPALPVVPPKPTKIFEAALLELMPVLRLFAISLCGRNDADDMCQATLVKALQAHASFEHGTNLKAWLFAILRNHFYSERRRDWRHSPWDDSFAERPAEPSQSAAAELSDVVRAMHMLPRAQREALILVCFGGFDYRQAAAMSGQAVGTMKSRVGRARSALATALDGSQARGDRPPHGEAINEMLAQLQRLAPNYPATRARRLPVD